MRSFSFYLAGNVMIFLMLLMHLIGYFAGTRFPETEAEEQFYFLLENLKFNLLGIERTYD